MKGSVTEDTARYSIITGARLLSVEEIAEHGRAARQHIANADAALARAGLSLREAERISDEVLGGKTSKPAAEKTNTQPVRADASTRDGQEHGTRDSATGSTAPAAGEETAYRCLEHDAEDCPLCMRVSDYVAESVADALVSPPVDSPTSRAYCRCGCGSNIGAVDEALRRSMLGVSPRAAVEDIAMAYGLDDAAQESVLDEVNEQLDDARRMGRLVHL